MHQWMNTSLMQKNVITQKGSSHCTFSLCPSALVQCPQGSQGVCHHACSVPTLPENMLEHSISDVVSETHWSSSSLPGPVKSLLYFSSQFIIQIVISIVDLLILGTLVDGWLYSSSICTSLSANSSSLVPSCSSCLERVLQHPWTWRLVWQDQGIPPAVSSLLSSLHLQPTYKQQTSGAFLPFSHINSIS